MKKKVLLLSASPRRGGNSDTLCDQFLRGAEAAGHTVEKIFVRDLKISCCLGCGTCQENGGTCVQEDDMAEILAKMIAAEVIVLATPVYFYAMNGQLKTLIDRTCPRYTEISDKDFYFIVAAADSSREAMERPLDGLRAFLSCLDGAREKGAVYGTGAWKIGDIKKSKAMGEAFAMGNAV